MSLIQADARQIPLRDGCVQCCVTSPPYFGLRDYGTANQIGLEPTPDAFVAALVGVFREVRRVLADDGVLWLNLGDSYAGSVALTTNAKALKGKQGTSRGTHGNIGARSWGDSKPKDLMGIPWRVAFALQQPYYAGTIRNREDRIWLAAMLDAEGCMFIHKRKAGQSNGQGYQRKNDTYGPGVEICNTSLAVVERVMALVGKGSICQSDKGRHGRKQTLYRWNLRTTESRDFVREIYPHLVAKQQQARILCGCPSSGEQAEAAHAALIALHNGIDTGVDFHVPASMFEPGWYLRSDVIWAKSNPMPESVTDRPTKAHEYLFLLTKSERYFYDAAAIQEQASEVSGTLRFSNRNADARNMGRAGSGNEVKPSDEQPDRPLTRNRRSVWTVPTMPFTGWVKTSRQVRVSWDESDGDTTRTTSPDCPVHGDRAVLAAKALCGERGADPENHSVCTDAGLAVAPSLDCAPIGRLPVDCSVDETTDSSRRSHEPPASPRSNRTRKTGHAPATTAPCMPSGEIPSGTGDTSASRRSTEVGSRTPESSTAAVSDLDAAVLAQMAAGSLGTCSCAYYRTVTEEMSHFATMPEKLVEPCILAGSRIGDRVFDPFMGSGTVGAVAERLGRRWVGTDLNPAYHALAKKRTSQRGLRFEGVA